jgi:glycosyltransferase involved in cell wall biosynthesis
MRIALANSSNGLVGGAETYLQAIGSYFQRQGHSVSFWYEHSCDDEAQIIRFPSDVNEWSAGRKGRFEALRGLQDWRPDVIYCQGLIDPETEAALQLTAPCVLFAHNYNGLCINGGRTMDWPVPAPCEHRFGSQCLVRFFPRRCGGLSPFTMWTDYRTNRTRLERAKRYGAVLTHSGAVARKFREHGVACRQIRFFIDQSDAECSVKWIPGDRWRLLMLSRMVRGKGGDVLLDALPRVVAQLKRPLHVVFAGDGAERSRWMQKALHLNVSTKECTIDFPGWVSPAERAALLKQTDLLVVPSVWPEPFGLVGLEAALFGVPSVAFSVGGIPDWLSDGVNGSIVEEGVIDADGLARAIVRCLSDRAAYTVMRGRARSVAESYSIANHYAELIEALELVSWNLKCITGPQLGDVAEWNR